MRAGGMLLGTGLGMVLSACGPPELAESSAAGLFSPSVQEISSGLYFLPPLDRPPALEGTFNGKLSPIVHVDWMDPSGTPLARIATFTTTSGKGSERIRVDWRQPSYIVNWHTGRYDLDTGTYRISVLLDGRVLGIADVELGGSLGSANRATQGNNALCGYHAVRFGAAIPIRFWLNGCAPVTCTALDQCHAPGTCDPWTELCSNPTVADGTSCSDDDECTEGDACLAGLCQSGTDICGCEIGFAGHYEGTATIDVAWGEVYGPDPPWDLICAWHTSTSIAQVVLDVTTTPAYQLSIALPGHAPVPHEIPLDFAREPWTLEAASLVNLWPCRFEAFEDIDLATLTIDPITGAAILNVTCTTAHLDDCLFPTNSQTDYTMVLPRICQP